MDTTILILISLVGLFNLALGFIILVSDTRRVSNYLYFFFCLSICLWAGGIALFLGTGSAETAAVAARAYYVAAALIGYTLLSFAIMYITERKFTWSYVILAIPTIVICGLCISGHGLVWDVTIAKSGNVAILNPQIYTWYSVYFLCYLYTGIALLGARLLMKGLKEDKRRQIVYLFIALLLAGTIGVFFNLILPFFGNYSLIWVGPVFSVLLVAFVFAAIVRHNMFNVRQATARTAAYAMLLVSLTVIYSLAVFTTAELFFNQAQASTPQSIVNTLFAVFLAFSFQPLKRFFDRITNRLFFRASYDLQEMINALGEIVIKRHTTKSLIDKSYGLIMQTIYPQKLDIVAVSPAGGVVYRRRNKTAEIDIPYLEKHMHSQSMLLISHGGVVADELKEYLKKHGIEAILRLNTSSGAVVYILIGHKISGSFNSNDERLLAVMRDELVIALENAMHLEEIEQFNQTLQKRVDEATSKLRTSNVKLRELDETKDEFISMASHQLRTPLTSVKGYLSMVLEGDVGDINPQQRKLLEEAFASSQRMVYLIGDFLNVSRIQTGKFELERADVSLSNIISEEISQLKATAKSRGIELAYEAPRDFPVMSVDENKIRQVMMNFIDNAIYYSPENTTITVSLAKYTDRIEFKVRDQGIGVPKEARQHLFTKFFRADNAKMQRPDGTGIGLFMAKKVVIEHGGAILFESEQGKGSMFGFRLPLLQPKTPLES